MLAVTDALLKILEDLQPLETVERPIEECAGFTLATDVVSTLDIPPFDNSAVDGFAVRTTDLCAATNAHPIVLPIRGESRAGSSPFDFPGGASCVRQMTGAPVPAGADAVVMKEDVSVSRNDTVTFTAEPRPGENVRPCGRDIRRGDVAVASGTLLRPSELAMLASIGRDRVTVWRKPTVAVLTTGDELMEPGKPLDPGRIYNSNRLMLCALVNAAGVKPGTVAHVPDSLDAAISALQDAASQHDVVISSGGVSVGDHDHMRAALEKVGEIGFWRVAMKPGKPLLFGRIGRCLYFGLPGNPVSSMVSFELFVRPTLLKFSGRRLLRRPVVRARLLGPISHRPGREEYARVTTTRRGEEFVADPHPGQASHLVSSMVHSNSLAIVPAEAGSLPEGVRVDVMMTEWPEE